MYVLYLNEMVCEVGVSHSCLRIIYVIRRPRNQVISVVPTTPHASCLHTKASPVPWVKYPRSEFATTITSFFWGWVAHNFKVQITNKFGYLMNRENRTFEWRELTTFSTSFHSWILDNDNENQMNLKKFNLKYLTSFSFFHSRARRFRRRVFFSFWPIQMAF